MNLDMFSLPPPDAFPPSGAKVSHNEIEIRGEDHCSDCKDSHSLGFFFRDSEWECGRNRLVLGSRFAGFPVEAAARSLGFLKDTIHSSLVSPLVFPLRRVLIPYPYRVVKKKCPILHEEQMARQIQRSKKQYLLRPKHPDGRMRNTAIKRRGVFHSIP